jgi:hypothetical protein
VKHKKFSGGEIMIKRYFVLLAALFMMVGCGNGNSNVSSSSSSEEKVYDSDFMSDLAKGLEARWELVDNTTDDTEMTAAHYKEALNKELEMVKEYKDKKFADSILQEYAISYINELNNGIQVADTLGADSFYETWPAHQNQRTKILNDINSIQEIPVTNKETLNQLLAQGKEVEAENKKVEAINNLVSGFEFQLNEEKSDEYYKYYSAVAENTTGYNISHLSLNVKLYDENDVNIETNYAYTDDWTPGEKTQFEFSTSETFSTVKLNVDFVDAE